MARPLLRVLPVAAPLAWVGVVLFERARPPKPAAFIPGSTDAMYADELETGDVLLFSRRCELMLPLGAAVCALEKRLARHHVDHCGVVVLDRAGVPFVLEAGFGGVRLRPYEQRVLRSRSHEVVLRPLRGPRSEEARERVRGLATALVGGGVGSPARPAPSPRDQPVVAAALVAEALRALAGPQGQSAAESVDSSPPLRPSDWAEGGRAASPEFGFGPFGRQHYIRV